ncbi:MAG: ChaN family lipoprotein [Humidesulfovibrio sp.]|uniref:ChaN family lipoprotein n=1 Tax=Humidesulfovibrio sp. TaxID=2910988 RepID=UPI0027376A1E|nr:ChaN family lipoprotein [Humidesulfovibrio sp.]MDP2847002.1 ChaN family lipoprotein [Humidesulfovibrio sp.]
MPSPTSSRALAAAHSRGRGAALFAALLLILLTACARPAPMNEPMAVSFLPAPGEMLTDAGDRLTPEAFMAKSRDAAYVLIGESHGNACDHEAERRVLTLLSHQGKGPAVGFEMVPAKNSTVLQDFVAGNIRPEDLEARLDWGKTWGHPFGRYLPVFLALREWKLPAAGLNVPPDVIRRLSAAAMNNATSDDPVGSLSAEDRQWLPKQIIEPAPEQLAFLNEVMSSHPPAKGKARSMDDPRQRERFLLIQSVWDSAMAERAVALRASTGRQVAVLAGTAHVEGGLGIARRIKVLDPGASILLVSPWRGDDLDPDDAQVRVYCPISFESRMGMVLESRPNGEDSLVVVAEVRRGSRAEAAGLRPGDLVERAGGYRMNSLNGLHLAGSDAFREKKSLVLGIRRGAACYTLDLGPLGQPGQQQSDQRQPKPDQPVPEQKP